MPESRTRETGKLEYKHEGHDKPMSKATTDRQAEKWTLQTASTKR